MSYVIFYLKPAYYGAASTSQGSSHNRLRVLLREPLKIHYSPWLTVQLSLQYKLRAAKNSVALFAQSGRATAGATVEKKTLGTGDIIFKPPFDLNSDPICAGGARTGQH